MDFLCGFSSSFDFLILVNFGFFDILGFWVLESIGAECGVCLLAARCFYVESAAVGAGRGIPSEPLAIQSRIGLRLLELPYVCVAPETTNPFVDLEEKGSGSFIASPSR